MVQGSPIRLGFQGPFSSRPLRPTEREEPKVDEGFDGEVGVRGYEEERRQQDSVGKEGRDTRRETGLGKCLRENKDQVGHVTSHYSSRSPQVSGCKFPTQDGE